MKLLRDYPNLEAIYSGTIAGEFRDWIAVRGELRRFVASHQAVNVSVDDLGWHTFQCPLCDGNLMCAKEALLAAAWCCEEGQRLGVKVCPACAATGAAYTAAMSPEQP